MNTCNKRFFYFICLVSAMGGLLFGYDCVVFLLSSVAIGPAGSFGFSIATRFACRLIDNKLI